MAKKKSTPVKPNFGVSVSWGPDSTLTTAEKKAYQENLTSQLLANPPVAGQPPAIPTAQPATAAAAAAAPTSAILPSVRPAKRGPSLSGPTMSGWTGASLVPQTTTAATQSTAPTTPGDALRALVRGGGSGVSGTTNPGSGGSNLGQYRLNENDLGAAPDLRRSVAPTTPLEQLLAQMFPDAAANFDPTAVDPMADPRNPGAAPSLFNTILSNLPAPTTPGAAYAAPVFGAPIGVSGGAGNQIAATIPGAPAFLGGAIDRVNFAGTPMQPMGGGAVGGQNALNIAGIAALAAEQRAQANQLAQEQAAANEAFFQQQQDRQRAQRMATQRQRQRFGGVNAITSGWGSSPVLF